MDGIGKLSVLESWPADWLPIVIEIVSDIGLGGRPIYFWNRSNLPPSFVYIFPFYRFLKNLTFVQNVGNTFARDIIFINELDFWCLY